LTNAAYVISIALKSTLIIPKNSSAYGVNLDSRMFHKTLYVVGKNMAGRKFQNSFGPYTVESETPGLHQQQSTASIEALYMHYSTKYPQK
jgi:hypothetical protein